MLEASNLKTMESWYQNLSPYVNDKEFPLRGGKKDLPPVLIGLKLCDFTKFGLCTSKLEPAIHVLISNFSRAWQSFFESKNILVLRPNS